MYTATMHNARNYGQTSQLNVAFLEAWPLFTSIPDIIAFSFLQLSPGHVVVRVHHLSSFYRQQEHM